MDFIAALVLMLGGDSGSPVDWVLPEAVSVRVRMLSLQEGMSEAEVNRRLGLTGRLPDIFDCTISQSYIVYPIGRTHRLALRYTLQGPGIVHKFSSATLRPTEAK
jgi:hypothetical protein